MDTALSRLFETEFGQIIVSIILGLGLAALFRKVCNGNSCVVIKGPDLNDVQKYYYKVDDKCYKYSAHVVKCADKA